MTTETNVQTVKDFFAATGRGDREDLLAQALARAPQRDGSAL